ncbi:ATP-dependent zinc metalloprotease FTSH, chloroplastic-like [Hordeum vulgare]|nr:ATP-dependent zinc metalloprotease FTSH, chloroplastic-like [Hordeum vulgare]
MLKDMFEYVLHAWKAVLEDPDDDVRVVAVDTLIPTAASLVRLNDQMLNSVAMSLWDILLDLNDISPCTSRFTSVLLSIETNPSTFIFYFKAGHALAGSLMPEYDPVAKISIIPRGQAGGLMFFAPSEERLESRLYSRSYLENQMAVALGDRVAEEVIFGQDNVTTRASSDFMHVSRVARQMVERFGLMYPFW